MINLRGQTGFYGSMIFGRPKKWYFPQFTICPGFIYLLNLSGFATATWIKFGVQQCWKVFSILICNNQAKIRCVFSGTTGAHSVQMHEIAFRSRSTNCSSNVIAVKHRVYLEPNSIITKFCSIFLKFVKNHQTFACFFECDCIHISFFSKII